MGCNLHIRNFLLQFFAYQDQDKLVLHPEESVKIFFRRLEGEKCTHLEYLFGTNILQHNLEPSRSTYKFLKIRVSNDAMTFIESCHGIELESDQEKA